MFEPLNSPPSAGHYALVINARKRYCQANGHTVYHGRCKCCGAEFGSTAQPEPTYGRSIMQLREELEQDDETISVGAAA